MIKKIYKYYDDFQIEYMFYIVYNMFAIIIATAFILFHKNDPNVIASIIFFYIIITGYTYSAFSPALIDKKLNILQGFTIFFKGFFHLTILIGFIWFILIVAGLYGMMEIIKFIFALGSIYISIGVMGIGFIALYSFKKFQLKRDVFFSNKLLFILMILLIGIFLYWFIGYKVFL